MEENHLQELCQNCESCVTKPCQIGCPLMNDITTSIQYMKQKDYENAYLTLNQTSILMSICGRICPRKEQCEGRCVKGVSFEPVQIGVLESTIGDMGLNYSWNQPRTEETKYHVALIGGGPASLTCAYFLRLHGISVTIYEKHAYLGGLLSHGIPEFRLPQEVVQKTIDKILQTKMEVKYHMELGKNLTIEELENQYDAIFIGIGANTPNELAIPGIKKQGVFYANEFLEQKKSLSFQDKTVAVYGGGNTAMDMARIAARKGAKKVFVLYRRNQEKMSADEIEREEAKQDGVEFLLETSLVEILGEDKVEKISIMKTKDMGEKLENVQDSNIELLCDYVFIAIGSHLEGTFPLELTDNHKIKIDANGHTSHPKIYAGGDATGTKSIVAYASRSGRNAAYEIIKNLTKESS